MTDETTGTAGTPVTAAPVDAKRLLDGAIILDVRMGKLGVRRKAKVRKIDMKEALPMGAPGAVLTDADIDLVSVSKKILDCPEYTAIVQHDRQTRNHINELALPSKITRGGMAVLAVGTLEEVYQWLAVRKAERGPLVQTFLGVYEQRCAESDARLESLADPSQHPPLEEVERAFYFEWQPLAFDVPTALKRISKSAYQQEAARIGAMIQGAAEEIQTGLCTTFAKLIAGMRKSLEPDAAGRKKKFYGSNLDNLVRYMELFSKQKEVIGGDESALAALVEEARQLIEGVDADLIRDNDELREAMATECQSLDERLADMAGLTRRRAIDLEAEA